MKTLTTILLLAISLNASGQKKYQQWNKPTKMHITGVVDSTQTVQRKHYTFYYNYVNGLKIATFTKYENGIKVSWYLKRLID